MSVNFTRSEGVRAERLRYCATTGRATCCVGPTGPTGSFDYTATHDIDMSCNRILDVSSVTFCDGTYMGPGASFDISTNQHLVISSTDVSGIDLNCYRTVDSYILSAISVGSDKINLTANASPAEINLAADLIDSSINMYARAGGGSVNIDATNVDIKSGPYGHLTMEPATGIVEIKGNAAGDGTYPTLTMLDASSSSQASILYDSTSLKIETINADTEIRHYNADTTTMETRMRILGGGTVAIGGDYNGSLFIERAGAAGYLAMNNDGSDRLVIQPGIKPDAIYDTTNATGSAGQFLGKDGANQLLWETAQPGGWAGTATTPLDMNQFSINNAQTIAIERPSALGNPQLVMTDNTSGNSITFNAVPASYQMQLTNASQLQVSMEGSSVEGTQQGVNTTMGYENYFRGMGLPLRIAQDKSSEGTTYMLMNPSGDVSLYSGSGGHLAIGTVNTIDAHGAEIVADDGIRLDAIGGGIILNGLPTKVYGGSGQLVVGGNNQAPGNIIVNKSDETLSATMAFDDGDNSFTIRNEHNIVVKSAKPITGQLAQSVWLADNGGTGVYEMNVINSDNVRRSDFVANTDGQMTLSATDKVFVTNPTGNSTEIVLQQSNSSIFGGGTILADAGAGEFVFKGNGDGTTTVVRGATSTSIQALAPVGVISNTVGGGEVITEFSADGTGKGKIFMKAETSTTPAQLTIDGTAVAGGTVTVDGVLIPNSGIQDAVGSIGSAGQFLVKNGSNALNWVSTVAGSWSGLATTDLNMNAFKIFNAPLLQNTTGNIQLSSSQTVRFDASQNIQLNSSQNVTIDASNTVINSSFSRGIPVKISSSPYTVSNGINWIICDMSGQLTLTLPTPNSNPGRELMLKNIRPFTVISNASNVVPLAGGAAGTAILPATAGSTATLVSDGTNWIIMQ